MGNYLVRFVRNSFKLIPILTFRLPSSYCALDPQLRPHQLPPHVPSTFGFIIGLRAITLSIGPTRHRLLRRRRNAPIPRLTRRFRQRHRQKSYRLPEHSPRFAFVPRLFRSISLADFRSDRPRTDAVRIFRPTWNRSFRPAPLHAATAPNPSKTPTVSLSSAKE